MKGIVFSVFNTLVEEKFGYEVWDDILDETQVESEGIYTSAGTYPDNELIALVVVLSEKVKVPVPDLIKAFGQYAFHKLVNLYPNLVEHKSIKEFLLSIHDVVHVEVLKLYPQALLPEFRYEDTEENSLVMKYYSTRNLPQFADGLIMGASEHFKIDVDVQYELIESDEPHYRFIIKFV